MTKILFIARESSGVNTGASLITERNLELLRNLHGYSNIHCHFINQDLSRRSQLFNALKMNLSGLTDSGIINLLSKIGSEGYDEVFIDNSLLGKLSKLIKSRFPGIKVTLFFHNVEYDYFYQLLHSSRKFWHLLSISAAKHNEQTGCECADELLFLNNRDANRALKIYHVAEGKLYRILPTSMHDRFSEEMCLNNESNGKLSLLFVGTLFFPNYHGIKWFADNVLPFINAELTIVGRGFETVANKFLNPNIKVVGTVESLDPYYYSADLVIAPIFKGSGMKTKLTEAMMFGKQIIGTNEAFEGYDINIASVGYLCNTAEDFIEAINRNRFKKFDTLSRAVFLENYDTNVSIKTIKAQPFKYVKEKKVVFSELARTGLIHNGINTNLVEVFKTYFKVKRIDFWGEVTHVNNLALNDVNFFPFYTYNQDVSKGCFKKVKLLARELGFVLAWLRILFYIRRKDIDIVVITSILPIVHLFMKYTISFIPNKTKVYVVLHGEIENINEHRNSYYKCLERAIESDSKIGDRFKYVVLANFIKSNLLASFSVKNDEVIAIPHPYKFTTTHSKNSRKNIKPIVFGSIGVHTKLIKQSHLIYEIADRFKPLIENGTIEFRIIGVLDDSMKPFENKLVKVISGKEGMLSKTEFEKEVGKLDYALFFAPEGAYRYTASGTVLDALKYQIPIVGLKNEFLKELYDMADQIGYFASDLDNLKNIIENLINYPNNIHYEEIQKNMLKAQSFFTVDNAINSLRNQD